MWTFRHVPVHLQQTVLAYRKLPRLKGTPVVGGWTYRTTPPLVLSGLSVYQTHVFVADLGSHSVLVFSLVDGTLVRQWGSRGTAPGQFVHPMGIAVSNEGAVVVTDGWNHRVQVFHTDGTFVRAWWSRGMLDGQFNAPYSVAITPEGQVIVTEWVNHRAQAFRLLDGTFLHQWRWTDGAVGADPHTETVFVTEKGEVRGDAQLNLYVTPTQVVIVSHTERRIRMFPDYATFSQFKTCPNAVRWQFAASRGAAVRGDEVVVVNEERACLDIFRLDGTFARSVHIGVLESELAVTRGGQLVVGDHASGHIRVFE